MITEEKKPTGCLFIKILGNELCLRFLKGNHLTSVIFPFRSTMLPSSIVAFKT